MMVENSVKVYIADFWQQRITHPDSVSIRVPASTANLGPGFDTVALALGIYLNLTLTLLPDDDKRIPLVTTLNAKQENLGFSACEFVSTILKKHANLQPNFLKRVRAFIQSEIPLKRGLGSSAAVAIGILWAAAKLSGKTTACNQLLTQVAMIEGHADNAAASLLGGLAIVANSNDNESVVAKKVAWPEKWEAILVVPKHSVSTAESRKLLPKNIPYKDAVYNLQHMALLLAAVQHENVDLMHEALHDRMHEKYRAKLVPELDELKKQLNTGPALGCVLSGSGSSVLVLVQSEKKKETIEKIELWQSSQNKHCDLLTLMVDQQGVQELHV